MSPNRVLLTGWFSTVGDIESLDIVRSWVDLCDLPYDMAPFKEKIRMRMQGVIDFEQIDPEIYSHLVVICGPAWQEKFEDLHLDLSRFGHCKRIGINLTMVDPLQNWNPFDTLIERDSDHLTRPDLTLLADTESVPVVGRCLIQKQSSYAGRERHGEVEHCFKSLIQRRDFAVIDLDTRWFRTKNGLKTPAHFLSALKRVDLLLTNRLHGMVYAIKAGVPVIAIDAIEGGAKVSAQAKILGWPQCIPIKDATPERLESAVNWCFSSEAEQVLLSCRKTARSILQNLKWQFLESLLPEPISSLKKETKS